MPMEKTESHRDSHSDAKTQEETQNNEDDEGERNYGVQSRSRQSGRATYKRFSEETHPDDLDESPSFGFGEMIDEYGSYIFAFFTIISVFCFAIMLSFAK